MSDTLTWPPGPYKTVDFVVGQKVVVASEVSQFNGYTGVVVGVNPYPEDTKDVKVSNNGIVTIVFDNFKIKGKRLATPIGFGDSSLRHAD